MNYTILVTPSQELICTNYIPIYFCEKNFDRFKFLIPLEYRNMIPTLQIILPDGKTGKIFACQYEAEEYKGHLVSYVDITEQLTAYVGGMKMWFTFFGEDQNSIVKTEYGKVEVLPHEGFSEVIPDSDITADIMTEIQSIKASISVMSKNKADNITVDNENNKLKLLSEGNVISEVTLPEEVTWKF